MQFPRIIQFSLIAIINIIYILLANIQIVLAVLNPIEHFARQLPRGVNLAFLAQTVGSNTPLIHYNSKQLTTPASTIKVLTALAAILQLGSNFRFITTFESHGKIIKNTLKGDLIARFTGDPTLSRQKIYSMIKHIKKLGILRIEGNIIIDTSIFSNDSIIPSKLKYYISKYFVTYPITTTIDYNNSSIRFNNANKLDNKKQIRILPFYHMVVLKQVDPINYNLCTKLYNTPSILNQNIEHYKLTNFILKPDSILMSFYTHNNSLCLGKIIKSMLISVGINFTGCLLVHYNNPGIILASTKSVPLRTLLYIMLKKSDNLIADIIFLTIGHSYFGSSGTWKSGSKAVRYILKNKANIDIENTVQIDGSGLSYYNLLSPKIMMRVLQYVALHDYKLNLISMLPLAGYDGTLQHRISLHNAGLDGKLSAKTGSLFGIYNLAGFITTANNHHIAFVQFLSKYIVRSKTQHHYLDKLTNFESDLYRNLYTNY